MNLSGMTPVMWLVIGAAAVLIIILLAKGFKIAFKGALSFITWILFITVLVGAAYLLFR